MFEGFQVPVQDACRFVGVLDRRRQTGMSSQAASMPGIGPSASLRASVVPSTYCMVKYGWSSHSPTWKIGTTCGWASREAAWASTRNRSMSWLEEAGPAEQPLDGDDPAAGRFPRPARPRPCPLGRVPRTVRTRRTGGNRPEGPRSRLHPAGRVFPLQSPASRGRAPSPPRSRRSPRASGGRRPARDADGWPPRRRARRPPAWRP